MNSAKNQPARSEREVFLQALDQSAGAERDAFVAAACANNPALKSAVEALLRNHKDEGFMQTAVSPPVTSGEAYSAIRGGGTVVLVAGERPGGQIGAYRLLQRIGEGGVGVVFMAEQEAPVRRRVALKVLKPGMDSESVIARFESEQQALALMDHPNIARVIDAGTTPAGRPFFVMDLVRGTRITEYCDQNHLSTRERLELFIQVCHAVQHAHQKGHPGYSGSVTDVTRMLKAMPSEEMLAIDKALDLLAAEDPAAANLVKLKYFVGMKMEEAAAALGLSLRNAERLWAYSKAWLRRKLADDGQQPANGSDPAVLAASRSRKGTEVPG